VFTWLTACLVAAEPLLLPSRLQCELAALGTAASAHGSLSLFPSIGRRRFGWARLGKAAPRRTTGDGLWWLARERSVELLSSTIPNAAGASQPATLFHCFHCNRV